MTHCFPDHFSARAGAYARYRPHYPAALFDWLAAASPTQNRAWDCAAGSGQAASPLARRFRCVIATDGSRNQLRSADGRLLRRVVSVAESVPLRSASIDLITVAQALHWFALPAFFAETRRCLVPGGILAVWTYALCEVAPAIDPVLQHFYHVTLAGCWPPERALVERGYEDIAFPFAQLTPPPFAMSAEWALDQLLGYLGTWSAVRNYESRFGTDPVSALRPLMVSGWGDVAAPRRIRWPLRLTVGRAGDSPVPVPPAAGR